MNKITSSILVLSLIIPAMVYAQDDKANRPSPPAQATGVIDGTPVTIHYGQPSVKDRTIFGELVPYGEVWRTGANEATTFEADGDVVVEGQALPAGQYALFTIPRENEDWTLIFNNVANQWGAFKYDESQDALRVPISPEAAATTTEKLTFDVAESGTVTLRWADTQLTFSVASAGQASN